MPSFTSQSECRQGIRELVSLATCIDPVSNVRRRTIQGRRSTYIITLQTTSEAHRLARHLNMMDFRSDKDMAMHLLRAQVLW